MTAKRFECDKGSRIIIDNETKLHYIMTLDWECNLVTKLLNQLNDENEQLKSDVYDWKASAEDYLKLGKSLKKENEELKKVANDFAENPTQHNLWKLRYVLKSGDAK